MFSSSTRAAVGCLRHGTACFGILSAPARLAPCKCVAQYRCNDPGQLRRASSSFVTVEQPSHGSTTNQSDGNTASTTGKEGEESAASPDDATLTSVSSTEHQSISATAPRYLKVAHPLRTNAKSTIWYSLPVPMFAHTTESPPAHENGDGGKKNDWRVGTKGPRTQKDLVIRTDYEFLPDIPEQREEWSKLYLELISPGVDEGWKASPSLEFHRQAARDFVGDRGYDELREAWLSLPLRRRVGSLASLLIGSLAESARHALLMLSVIPILPRNFRTRCECLAFVDRVYGTELRANSDLQDLFAAQIGLVSNTREWPAVGSVAANAGMPHGALALLLRHHDPKGCHDIIESLFQVYETVPPRAILVIVDHFIRKGDAEAAMELLLRIPAADREKSKERILDRCASLISIDTIQESDSAPNFKILPRLIELGMPMDAKAHNLIIERAIALKLPDVAWEVSRFMEDQNIPVDARSHLFLLKDSFERQNRERMDIIMTAIHEREDLYQWPYIVAYMMHIVRVVCVHDRQLSPEVSTSHVLAVYDRVYDRAPLIELGLVEAFPDGVAPSRRLPQPTPAVLGFTIWAYVLCRHKEVTVSRLWHWIVHLIKQGDPSIRDCAGHDIMYNAFIHYYAYRPDSLSKAVYVIEEMMELGLCPPTQRTWSEVLCGFLRFGEEEAAEKIWKTMLAKDVQLTEGEWAFLLDRYESSVLAQQIRHVLDERRMPDWPGGASELEAPSPGFEDAEVEHQTDFL